MSQPVTATSAAPTASHQPGAAAAVSGGPGAGGAGTGSTISLPNPPPALSALSTGQVIRAVAIGRTADGKVLLETRFGQLALPLATVPVRGAVLQFQITQSGVPTELTLLNTTTGKASKGTGSPAIQPLTAGLRAGDVVTLRPVPVDGEARTAPPFQARLVSISASRLDANPATGNSIIGRVVSSPGNGPTLLQMSSGPVSLPGVGNLKTGVHLIFEPSAAAPSNTAAPATAGPQSLTTLGVAWTALEDAHTVLTTAEAGAATSFTASAIPAPGPNLTTGMVFLLNALFHGNLQEWLGRDALRVLESSEKSVLLSRLSEDFGQLSRLASEPVNGEWRVAMLPLLDDGVLQQIRFYLRHHDAERGDGADLEGTRFVVEASLSELGPLQLDGLVRPGRFDLMVRSHSMLPPATQDDITVLFEAANAEFSATGNIGFQVQNPFNVAPLDEIAETAAGVYA